jgi:hypothetical protein
LITQQQTEEKELTMNKSPRALALEAHPFDPACLTVAGDATTPNGQRYVDSFLNDYRNPNMVSWSPAHEALVLSLVQTARPADNMPIAVNVPVGEADGVVLMTTPDGVDVLVEDGRQRRRSSVVFNARLRWIADVFMTQLLSTDAPTIEDLKQRLLDFGPDGAATAVHVEGDEGVQPPPICRGSYDAPPLQPGDVIAPWLTKGFVEAITSSTPFFTEEGEAIPLFLRLDVRGEDIDLSDPTLLLHNILRKESVIPTPRAVKAQQVRRLLDLRTEDGEPIYTSYTLAQKLGLSADTINHLVEYLAIDQKIRAAVNADQISLKLAVTGREAICFGYDDKNKRHLLSAELQCEIFTRLCDAFRVEVSDGGIADNMATRAVLRKIKAEALQGTEFAAGTTRPGRETASVKASREAAARVGVDVFDDMAKGLSRVAAEAAAEEDEGDSDYSAAAVGSDSDGGDKTAVSKKKPTIADRHVEEASKPASMPTMRVLREQIHERAKKLRANVETFDLRGDDDVDSNGLVLSTAHAVLCYLDGDSTALIRFPVLAEALRGVVAPSASAPAAAPVATKPAPSAKPSPFAIADMAKDIVAKSVDLWEDAKQTEPRQIAEHLNTAAEEMRAPAEALIQAAAKLESLLKDFAARPLPEGVAVFVRESLT